MERRKEKVAQIGSREFRTNFSKYLNGAAAVAITAHGQVIGYYVPANSDDANARLGELRAAAARLQALIHSLEAQPTTAAVPARPATPTQENAGPQPPTTTADLESEIVKSLRKLSGGREPPPELIQSVHDLAKSRNASLSRAVECLQRLVHERRNLTPDEIKGRLRLSLY